MNFYSKTEIAKQLGISRTVVTQYLRDYDPSKGDILEYIKQKYIENTSKKGAATHSVIKDLKVKLNELENLLEQKDKIIAELNKKIKELEAKIEELSKNRSNNRQNDLTESSITRVSTQTNSKIQLKKGATKPDMELLKIVILSKKQGLSNAEIAKKYGVDRRTVWRYVNKINNGDYKDYIKQLNLL